MRHRQPDGTIRTILCWPRSDGWLAAWWEPDRSAPYDVKWGSTLSEARGRLA